MFGPAELAVILLVLLSAVACLYAAVVVARRKGRRPGVWFVLTLVSPIFLLVLLLLGPAPEQPAA